MKSSPLTVPPEVRDAAVKLLASLLTAAGFAGIVAFVGGATLWMRFSAAELPAEQAVGFVPRTDLITVGALYMTTFAVAGLIAVAGAYVADTDSLRSAKSTLWVLLLGLGGLGYALVKTNDGPHPSSLVLVCLAAAGAAAFVALVVVGDKWKRRVGAGAALSFGAVGAYLGGEQWGLFLALITVVVVGSVVKVARAAGLTFFWYGITLFVATVAFGASIHVARTMQEPKVQPVAILINSEQGDPLAVAALFVAETSDRVYFGRVDCQRRGVAAVPVPASGRVLSVKRSDVRALAVGPLQDVEDALARAARMVEELRPPASPATGGAVVPVPVPGCSAQQSAVPPLEGEEITDDQARTLAARFRPWLRFDSAERWRPVSVSALLAERHEEVRHQVCAPAEELQGGCRDVRSADELRGDHSATTFLDLVGDSTPDSYCAPGRCDRLPADCGDCDQSAIYYRVQRANGRYYIDYWWFMRFNHAPKSKRAAAACLARLKPKKCFDHEGDWEGITVATSSSPPHRLESASLAAHDRVVRYAAGQLELVDGRRPVIYVAAGTHAAYPTACPSRGPRRALKCGQTFRRFGSAWPEGRRDGAVSWARNTDIACYGTQQSSCLLPIGGLDWNKWPGQWGSCARITVACKLGQGPRSPSLQTRWRNPSCFHRGRTRLCDVAAPA